MLSLLLNLLFGDVNYPYKTIEIIVFIFAW